MTCVRSSYVASPPNSIGLPEWPLQSELATRNIGGLPP